MMMKLPILTRAEKSETYSSVYRTSLPLKVSRSIGEKWPNSGYGRFDRQSSSAKNVKFFYWNGLCNL